MLSVKYANTAKTTVTLSLQFIHSLNYTYKYVNGEPKNKQTVFES